MNGLSVEPGSNRSVITRLRSCAPVRRARLFGLYEGMFAEREDFAGAHVDRDHRAGLGAMALDRALQRAEREALDLAVDRQREVGAVLRAADRLDVLDDAAEAVADHAAAARLAAERVLVRELDALLAGVVDPGKADYVSGYFTARVVAAVLDVLVDPLEPERLHCGRRFRAEPGASGRRSRASRP